MPPRKTVTFKGEKKKTQNWFQRQFSGQMNEIDDPSDGEFATAVAAAALAIALLEGEGSLNQKRTDEELKRILTKTQSRTQKNTEKPNDQSKLSKWFSIKEEKENGRSAGESSMRKSATLDQRLAKDSTADQQVPVKAMGTTPSVKKTPTFSDKYLNDMGNKRTEQGQLPRTGQNVPSTMKPRASLPASGSWDEDMINSIGVETKVDAWKKAKMAKIKKRYEKLMSTIMEWENEKKVKAKHRMERKEREIEVRRARVLQEHRNEISRIDKIAGGAREVAEEKKRNDESKTIKKAEVFSSTGKVPKECSCC